MGESGPEKSSEAVAQPPGASAGATSIPVFISYASQDAAVANSVVESLEGRGVRCWMAPQDVKAGAQYADAIVRAIMPHRAQKSVVIPSVRQAARGTRAAAIPTAILSRSGAFPAGGPRTKYLRKICGRLNLANG
jgi:hypothetical protein